MRTSSRSASTVSNSLTSLDPLVGELGEHLLLGVLDEHPEGDLFAGALAEALGQRVVELEDVAGPLAVQLLVELRHDDPRADLVEEVGGGEALDRLVVDEALDVDLGVVAVDERRVGVGEVGEALAQLVDLACRRRRRSTSGLSISTRSSS